MDGASFSVSILELSAPPAALVAWEIGNSKLGNHFLLFGHIF